MYNKKQIRNNYLSFVFLIGIIIVVLTSCQRENNNKMDSFLGINLGMPIWEVKNQLINSGWTVISDKNEAIILENDGASYQKLRIKYIRIGYNQNCSDSFTYYFEVDKEEKKQLEKLKENMIMKYNLQELVAKKYESETLKTYDYRYSLPDDKEYWVIFSIPEDGYREAFISFKPSDKELYPYQKVLTKLGLFDRDTSLSEAKKILEKENLDYALDYIEENISLTVTEQKFLLLDCDYVQYDFKKSDDDYQLYRSIAFVNNKVSAKTINELLQIWQKHYGKPTKNKQTILFRCSQRDTVGVIENLTAEYKYCIVNETK